MVHSHLVEKLSVLSLFSFAEHPVYSSLGPIKLFLLTDILNIIRSKTCTNVSQTEAMSKITHPFHL